jgi:hypothetical protein
MPAYRHYADYVVKRAMSDLGSMDDFLRHVLFIDSLWDQKVMGFGKEIRGFEGTLQREDLNKAIKQETLDGGFLFHNARVIVDGEDSLSVEDIYQLLRQEAAVLEPGQTRKALVALIISLSDSPIHRIDKKPCPFLEITNILGPKTFIGFASINLYLIDVDFYENYFASLSRNWSQAEVERVLDRSFGSLLLSYWARRLWLEKDKSQGVMGRLDALKGFLDTIWNKTQYGRIFYETMVLFKDLPELTQFFDEGGLKMKSFVDTMPEPTRKIYEEVLVAPVVKVYEEKLKQGKLEREKIEAKLEREKIEGKLEREKIEAKLEREKIEAKLEREKIEAELEKTEAELEKERIEAKLEKEKVEENLRTTCQQVIFNKFPDISASALVAVNQLSFSQCNQLLRGLDKIRDAHECEAFLKNLQG